MEIIEKEDQLIGYDLAKLLFEKNITFISKNAYFKYKILGMAKEISSNSIIKDTYPAVTQTFLKKWLIENYKMYVIVTVAFYGNGINHEVQVLTYDKEDVDGDYYSIDKCSGMFGDNGEFDTYEDALEFGLTKAINLI